MHKIKSSQFCAIKIMNCAFYCANVLKINKFWGAQILKLSTRFQIFKMGRDFFLIVFTVFFLQTKLATKDESPEN